MLVVYSRCSLLTRPFFEWLGTLVKLLEILTTPHPQRLGKRNKFVIMNGLPGGGLSELVRGADVAWATPLPLHSGGQSQPSYLPSAPLFLELTAPPLRRQWRILERRARAVWQTPPPFISNFLPQASSYPF